MKNIISKPFIVFAIGTCIMLCVFFFFRIDIFPGEIITKDKIFTCDISLSYFIHKGAPSHYFNGIEKIKLLPKGYLLASILILGFPGLVAYRIYLKKKK
jgi:hypothetical protein